MRSPLLAVTLLFALFAFPLVPAGSHLAALAPAVSVVHAQDQAPAPAPPARVDIQVNHGGRAWYASPVWIAIGVIGLVLLIMLIVMASRGGGGTTVVR